MIFIGDVAYPFVDNKKLVKLPFADLVIANLEGAFASSHNSHSKSLINNEILLNYFKENKIKIISLANNHITDITDGIHNTIEMLKKENILFCGAGNTLNEAALPAEIEINNTHFYFLSYGWPPIGCRTASQSRAGVNPLTPKHVLKQVKDLKNRNSKAKIVLLVHWNYELELYPQPLHRQLSFALIDAGASAVIGTHSHCVQGIEIYKKSPIVYGLGNWYIPHNYFFNETLEYPDFSCKQLAFEWDSFSGDMKCHWYNYEKETSRLTYTFSETLITSSYIKSVTPFRGMPHQEYITWFKNNRRKKKFLPVYKNYQNTAQNTFYDIFLTLRHYLIQSLLFLKFKKIKHK